jgi:outer membrane cobalamin receptor
VALDTVVSPRTHQPIAFHDTFAEDRGRHALAPAAARGSLRRSRRAALGCEWRQETTSGPKTSTTTTTSTSGEVTRRRDGCQRQRAERAPRRARRLARHADRVGRARVEAGARYDWYRSFAESTATSWSPALDVIDERLSLDGGIAVRSARSSRTAAWRAGSACPNLEERYYRGPVHGAILVYGNPALVPERNVTYERACAPTPSAGARRACRRTARSRKTSSRSRISARTRDAERSSTRTLDRVQIDGVEASGELRLGGLKAVLSVTLPRGRDLETGDRVPEVGAAGPAPT